MYDKYRQAMRDRMHSGGGHTALGHRTDEGDPEPQVFFLSGEI
jgi:hypothetical protein